MKDIIKILIVNGLPRETTDVWMFCKGKYVRCVIPDKVGKAIKSVSK